MDKDYRAVLQAMAEDILNLSKQILARNDIGANRKTGKNTLSDSSLADNIRVEAVQKNHSFVINAYFDNYIKFIEHGRKAKTGKFPPLDAIRDWAMEKGIPTDNSTLFLISRAIWRDGYEGRPVLATLEEEVGRLIDDKWSDILLESLTNELEKQFI